MKRNKVLVILGPTSSGKTKLGVSLAIKFNGEIISADSRQIYKGMDVGTGKDLKEYKIGRKKIPYHLIDLISPKTKFNLAKYQKLAQQAIDEILQRGRLPIIVGGTGLYIQAVVDNYKLSHIKPDRHRRLELEKLTAIELFKKIKKLKPGFAAKLNNSDKNNARRLQRYLEIIEQGGFDMIGKQKSKYNFLVIGLDWPNDVLKSRLEYRLLYRLEKEALVAEVHRLHQEGVPWSRLISFGLEYKFISWYLQGKLDYKEMVEKLTKATYHFAKRQKTWFKRWEKQGREIKWLNSQAEGEEVIKKWLQSNLL